MAKKEERFKDLGRMPSVAGISELDAANDLFQCLDVSDRSDAKYGTRKGIAFAEMMTSLGLQAINQAPLSGGGATFSSAGGSSSTAGWSTQSGYYHAQAGSYNTQAGYNNTQSGNAGSQAGSYLNDGGFDDVHMLGSEVTATVANAIYLSASNGVRLTPLASPPTGLTNGTIWINTAGDLLFRGNGVTKTVTAT